MFKNAILGILFFAAFFTTIQHFQSDAAANSAHWGAGLEVAHARGK